MSSGNKGVVVSVLYPRTENYTFDEKYYIDTHLALCQKYWGPHGLKNWSFTKLAEGPYIYSTSMDFESPEAFGKAMGDPGTKEITEDVAKFTNTTPTLIQGGVLARSSL